MKFRNIEAREENSGTPQRGVILDEVIWEVCKKDERWREWWPLLVFRQALKLGADLVEPIGFEQRRFARRDVDIDEDDAIVRGRFAKCSDE